MAETFIKKRPLLADTEGGLSGFKASGEMGDVTVDDVTAFLARFQNGATGTFEATRLAPGRKNYNRWEINGEKGSIAFNLERMNEFEIYLTDDPQGVQGFHLVQATENFMPYMEAYWPVAHNHRLRAYLRQYDQRLSGRGRERNLVLARLPGRLSQPGGSGRRREIRDLPPVERASGVNLTPGRTHPASPPIPGPSP